MESADKNDEQMSNEQPGPSKSSLPVETADESQDASPPLGSDEMESSTLNLYTTLGLSPEDVDALAQIPESEISIETLPHLIMQLKAKRAQCGGQPETSSPKEEVHNDQEDWEAVSTDSAPHRSTSKPPVHSHSADDNYSKTESHEHLGLHVRCRREPKFAESHLMDDFRGAMPRYFPHTCSLCHCTLYSAMPWNDHVGGSRHLESRRYFLRTHPDWDPHDASSRVPDSHSGEGDGLPVKRDSRSSLSRKRPHSTDYSPGQRHFTPSYRHLYLEPKAGTKLVVIKFVPGTVAVEDLLGLAKPFGTVVKHLIVERKAFLELSSHKEAVNMVNHYAAKPAYVKDNKLALYLSPTFECLHIPKLDKVEKHHKRPVVCFSNLPSDKESESEILEVAKLFGEVRYSKVHNNENYFFSGRKRAVTQSRRLVDGSDTVPSDLQTVLIEMEDWTGARIMVKYYHSNPLKIFGKNVMVSMSSSHKKLRLSPDPSRRGDSSRSSSSLPKSKEASRSSHLKNKDKTSLQKDLTEEKNVDGGDQRAIEEHEHMDVNLDSGGEDEQGMKVEDEQEEEDLGQGDTADEQILKEPLVETNASQKEDSEGSGVEMDQNLEEITLTERPPVNSQENPDKASTLPVPTKEPTSVENPEDKMGDTKDIMEEYNEKDEEDMDFPDNMEDFVTLDELDNDAGDTFDSEESSEGGKVVIVRPVLKGPRVSDVVCKLAEPFGKVTNHTISFFRQQALLELESNEAATRMVRYYERSKKALLFGRPVSVSMCLRFPRLEAPSGKSIYISMLPRTKYSDISLLRLAQPFGKISAYDLNWHLRKCYIQMESVEAAQKMLQKYMWRPPKFYGSVLRILSCRKGDSMIPWKLPVNYERWCAQQKNMKAKRDRLEVEAEADADSEEEAEEETENGQSTKSPAAKTSTIEDGGQSTVSDGDGAASASAGTGGLMCDKEEKVEQKSDQVPVPLGPYQPDNPVGIDYIVQRTGFFCKLCKVFYTNEKTAKSLHCSSLAHYQKLKMKLAEDPSE